MVNPQKGSIKKTVGVKQLPRLKDWSNINAKNFQSLFKNFNLTESFKIENECICALLQYQTQSGMSSWKS